MKRKGRALLLVSVLLAGACSPAPADVPTRTPAPTVAQTPAISPTSVPTAAPTIEATLVSEAAATRVPMPAPEPARQLTTSIKVETVFEKTLGGGNVDAGNSVQQTTDGGYIVAGFTQSYGAGGEDVYLVKVDAQGEEEWSRTFGGPNQDNGWVAQQTTDGGYIVAGFTRSFGAGLMDVYLVKTDAQGEEEWSRTFGGPDDEYSWAVQQTTDGGYIIVAQTKSYGAGGIDAYLIKTDADGKEEWAKTYGGSRIDRVFSIQQTTDGGYIAAGITSSFAVGGEDMYLVKVDAQGEEEWTRTFGDTRRDVAHAVRQTADGGYLITGYVASFGARIYDICLVKTDAAGELQWAKMVKSTKEEHAIFGVQVADGGYIVVGFTKGASEAPDLYLVKTDAAGDVQWTKSFGGGGEDTGYHVQQDADGAYVVVGSTWSHGAGLRDVYLIKVVEKDASN